MDLDLSKVRRGAVQNDLPREMPTKELTRETENWSRVGRQGGVREKGSIWPARPVVQCYGLRVPWGSGSAAPTTTTAIMVVFWGHLL